MIALVIIGHIHFPSGVRSAADAITGKQPAMDYVDFPAGMAAEELEQHVADAIISQDQGHGVLLLTDIAAGTPHQVAMKLAFGKADRAVLTGCNLSMVIEAIMEREHQSDLLNFADQLTVCGKQAIQHTLLTTGEKHD